MKVFRGTCTPNQMNWEVTVDGVRLDPHYGLRNHSPDGFSWGYSGSGPAQLALAILVECVGELLAQAYYQQFKATYVAKLDMGKGFLLTSDEVFVILRNLGYENLIG